MHSIRLAAIGGLALFVVYVLGGAQQAAGPGAVQMAASGDHGGIIILDPTRASTGHGAGDHGGIIILDPTRASSGQSAGDHGGIIILDPP